MEISLNSEQAKGLANFFFDMAKGLVLGGLGLATVNRLELKLISVFLGFVVAFACIRFALFLLEEAE